VCVCVCLCVFARPRARLCVSWFPYEVQILLHSYKPKLKPTDNAHAPPQFIFNRIYIDSVEQQI